MATATTNGSNVIKPDHEAGRKHFIFTQEHEDLRESMQAWVEEGALAPPQRVGGDLLADRGDEAGRRARLPRPLLPGGVRRAGRRLLLLAGPRRVHELLGLGRHQHGLRRADRHGPAPDPPARHRGAEAALPRPGDQGREDRLPRDHRARRRLRRRRDPHHGDPRRRRVRDQRLEDLHHQRRRAPTSSSSSPRPTPTTRHDGITLFLVDLRDENGETGARLQRLAPSWRRWACTPPTPASWPSRTSASRPTPCSARIGKGFYHIAWELQGERLVAAAGCHAGRRADVREDARVREGARGLRPPDRQVPGDPPQVRRDGDQDRGGEAVHLRDRLALRQRRVPGARDHDGEALRLAHRPARSPTSASRSSAATAT